MSSRRSALSLLELTIVMLILGITAAMATPRLADAVAAVRLRSVANQLASHIDYVRRTAVTQSQTLSLVFDNSLTVYRCDGVTHPEHPGEPFVIDLGDRFDMEIKLAASFDDQSTLVFDFEGVPHVGTAPMASGRVALALGGYQYAVVVEPGTGFTSVSEIK